MPYTLAHPVAVIPLARALGGRAVVSALVIGSMIPDAWYLVPGLGRPFSHNPAGLLEFCLPAGFLAYLAFHLLLKEPLLQLLPREAAARARGYACAGLPRASWAAVLACLLIGAATHLLWDAFTHEGPRMAHVLPGLFEPFHVGPVAVLPSQVLQHGSTLLGFAGLLWWIARKLRAARPVPAPALSATSRAAVLVALAGTAAFCFAQAWPGAEPADLRRALRAGFAGGSAGLAAAILLYSALYRAFRRPGT